MPSLHTGRRGAYYIIIIIQQRALRCQQIVSKKKSQKFTDYNGYFKQRTTLVFVLLSRIRPFCERIDNKQNKSCRFCQIIINQKKEVAPQTNRSRSGKPVSRIGKPDQGFREIYRNALNVFHRTAARHTCAAGGHKQRFEQTPPCATASPVRRERRLHAIRGGLPCTPRTPPSSVGHVVPDVPETPPFAGRSQAARRPPYPPARSVPAAQPAFHPIPRY